MKRKNDSAAEQTADCPIHKAMEIFQGKWNTWVLFVLGKNGTMRFGEIKKAVPGISNTMLTSTLKNLEAKGFIDRIQYNEIPPHVEYAATEAAKAFSIVFDSMVEWGEKYGK